jgi:hypothetical protein
MQTQLTRRNFLTSSAVLTGAACLPSNAFAVESSFNSWQWGAIGTFSPATNPVAKQLYPMEFMTKWHAEHHIPGLTGTWMDTVPGKSQSGGWYHRTEHGHHLFKDGMTVLRSDKLKFGDFLHHLGMDSFTKVGVPNPLLPTGTLFNVLKPMVGGKVAEQLLTVNVPKILGGSLALLVAGNDVYACFADTIPHTWTAVAWHGGLGLLDLAFGCFPPNPFILLSSGMELGVAGVTAVRTLIDNPATQTLLQSAMVYFPMWGTSAALAALFGACMGYWSGDDWTKITTGAGVTFTGSAVGALAGHFIAPFVGAAAGFVTGLLLRQIFLSSNEEYRLGKVQIPEYFKKPNEYFGTPPKYFNTPPSYFGKNEHFNQQLAYFGNQSEYFSKGAVVPIRQVPEQPIGRLEKDGELILFKDEILKSMETKKQQD